MKIRSLALAAAWLPPPPSRRSCRRRPLAQAKTSSSSRCSSTAPAPTRRTACPGPTATWTTSSWSTPRRRHQRRQDHLRGMRDRLRHRHGRRVLRAPEGQERRRHRVPAAVHRHHLRADREGAGRQDSAHHRRLWPQRKRRRQRLQVELPADAAPTGWPPTSWCSTSRKKEGGLDKLKGKKIALVYHDSPVRQGADPAAAGARQDARLRAAAAAGHARPASSRSRPGCRCASSGPTTCCCGAGA